MKWAVVDDTGDVNSRFELSMTLGDVIAVV